MFSHVSSVKEIVDYKLCYSNFKLVHNSSIENSSPIRLDSFVASLNAEQRYHGFFDPIGEARWTN